MKKFLALVVLFGLTSFTSINDRPCHPLGDVGVCTHIVSILAHSYDYDSWGNTYPCTHYVNVKAHAYDMYPCVHYCD